MSSRSSVLEPPSLWSRPPREPPRWARVGRGPRRCPVEIPLPGPAGARPAGERRAAEASPHRTAPGTGGGISSQHPLPVLAAPPPPPSSPAAAWSSRQSGYLSSPHVPPGHGCGSRRPRTVSSCFLWTHGALSIAVTLNESPSPPWRRSSPELTRQPSGRGNLLTMPVWRSPLSGPRLSVTRLRPVSLPLTVPRRSVAVIVPHHVTHRGPLSQRARTCLSLCLTASVLLSGPVHCPRHASADSLRHESLAMSLTATGSRPELNHT